MQLGVNEISVKIKAVDLKACLVLVEFYDIERLEMAYFWLPVSCLLPVTNPLPENDL